MMTPPLVLLATGGTGGHIFPAKALAEQLLVRGYRAALVTDRRGNGMGDGVPGAENYTIRAGAVTGGGLVRRAKGVVALGRGLFDARHLVSRLAPAAAIGFGSYASVPAMLAAVHAGIPSMIHEQNAVLGRANRLIARWVDRIATSFEGTAMLRQVDQGKVIHTGNPVRRAVSALAEADYASFGDSDPIRLLVIGGSQGARVFSQVVPEAIRQLPVELRWRVRVTQQCRPEDLADVRQVYGEIEVAAELRSFFDDLDQHLAAAHLVIARAGASTVAELTVAGRPAILVPYPSAADDHQSANGRALDEAGGAWLMPEDGFNPARLAERLASLLAMPVALSQAAGAARRVGRPNAAAHLADLTERLLDGNGAHGAPEPGQEAA